MICGDDHAMIESVLWFLGNILGENAQFRDLILESTKLTEIFNKLVERQKISRYLLRTLCWVNSNIFRFKGFSSNDARAGL